MSHESVLNSEVHVIHVRIVQQAVALVGCFHIHTTPKEAWAGQLSAGTAKSLQ